MRGRRGARRQGRWRRRGIHLHLPQRHVGRSAICSRPRVAWGHAHRDVAPRKRAGAGQIVGDQHPGGVPGAQRIGGGVRGRVRVAHPDLKVLQPISAAVGPAHTNTHKGGRVAGRQRAQQRGGRISSSMWAQAVPGDCCGTCSCTPVAHLLCSTTPATMVMEPRSTCLQCTGGMCVCACVRVCVRACVRACED